MHVALALRVAHPRLNLGVSALMFNISQGKGVSITFANGYTVSVQWGPFNYCDNKEPVPRLNSMADMAREQCKNAEVAVIAPGGGFVRGWPGNCRDGNEFGDDVKGWVEPDQVLEIMLWAATRR